MFSTLKADLRRKAEWYEMPPSFRSLVRVWFSDGTAAQVLYRTMRYCQTHRMKLLAALIYRANAFISHAVIGRGADIGPGFVLVHSVGVVINTSVRAGRNLVVEHGVTIGAEKNRSPILGDNVFLGAGAKVIGAVVVGSDVKIGANAVVTSDIPDGATAVGIPARVVRVYGEKCMPSADPEENACAPGSVC